MPSRHASRRAVLALLVHHPQSLAPPRRSISRQVSRTHPPDSEGAAHDTTIVAGRDDKAWLSSLATAQGEQSDVIRGIGVGIDSRGEQPHPRAHVDVRFRPAQQHRHRVWIQFAVRYRCDQSGLGRQLLNSGGIAGGHEQLVQKTSSSTTSSRFPATHDTSRAARPSPSSTAPTEP
jgi:hypothetical protein